MQGDKTGDLPLVDVVKQYIAVKYQKPGAVFLGVIHRLDRPTSGVVAFARTSKALSRMNVLFKERETQKIYWALVKKSDIAKQDTLKHFLVRNPKQNKSYASLNELKNSKKALLNYKIIQTLNHYFLLEIELFTGRHHQIRAQLAAINSPIKGDLKYGFNRSNPDGSICLHARSLKFIHPVTKALIVIEAPTPTNGLWDFIE